MIYIIALLYAVAVRPTQTGTTLGVVADIVLLVAVLISAINDILKWRDRRAAKSKD